MSKNHTIVCVLGKNKDVSRYFADIHNNTILFLLFLVFFLHLLKNIFIFADNKEKSLVFKGQSFSHSTPITKHHKRNSETLNN